MIRIQLPPTPSVSKFQRPSFGDGRLYLSTSNGYIQCLGESRINAYVSKRVLLLIVGPRISGRPPIELYKSDILWGFDYWKQESIAS